MLLARMEIKVDGMEELELQLSKVGDVEVAKRVVMAGAQPVADAIRSNLQRLSVDNFRYLTNGEIFMGVPKDQKQDLLNSLGIAPPDVDFNGDTNTKIGFDGYGSTPTKKYPKGLPNPLLARSIESGSSVRKKQPFIRPAVNRTKRKALEAMQKKLDEEIEMIMK